MRDRALVVGAGIAGLLAAGVLVDHFERVTVVERDLLPNGPLPRRGVPQALHVHALLVQGSRVMERLLPGLGTELVAAGADVVDVTNDVLRITAAGAWPRFPSTWMTYACSRTLLEWTIRRRLLHDGKVDLAGSYTATGLLAALGGVRVTGARVRASGGPAAAGGGERELHADLVVDASGRGAGAPRWLEALGLGRPQRTSVTSFLGYASRQYRQPDGLPRTWKSLLLASRPPDLARSAAILPMEDQRWIVTLAGAAPDYPPGDEAGFLAFAHGLPEPVVADAIAFAEPLTPIAVHRGTENRLYHYERLDRWPEGFVVLGDAACALNPVYGQGMTAAALAALTLQRHAGRHLSATGRVPAGFARAFQRELARANEKLWTIATSEDFRFPATVGDGRSWRTRVLHGYADRLLDATPESRRVCASLVAVANLVRPTRSLLSPPTMAAAAIAAARWRARGWR